MLAKSPPHVDWDAFVDRVYAIAEEPNRFTGNLSESVDSRLTWFVLKLAITELLTDEWLAWKQGDAEEDAGYGHAV